LLLSEVKPVVFMVVVVLGVRVFGRHDGRSVVTGR
jgi:hypothetical protein